VDHDHAIADYTQAIALNPEIAIFYDDRANAYNSKRDYAHAIADYSQIIALDPKNADTFNGGLLRQGHHRSASSRLGGLQRRKCHNPHRSPHIICTIPAVRPAGLCFITLRRGIRDHQM
jgi:tetratricopeptide (TPR) repeat protein